MAKKNDGNHNQELTPEEMETRRGYALQNLGDEGFSQLRHMAVAGMVESGDVYGSSDKNVAHQHLYIPSAISGNAGFINPKGEQVNVLGAAFASAIGRSEGRYNESVNGRDVLNAASEVVQSSLRYVKVGDIVNLIGGEADLGDLGNRYISDILESGGEEEKTKVQKLIGAYMQHFVSGGLSRAYAEQASAISGGLENILQDNDSEE